MSDKPIVVSTKPLQLSGTVRGPIVVTPQEGDSGDTTPRLGYNQITYKVKLVANGKTFNMLLPPSIESKHPGRSNPLQLPGLQIKANINISKLKIPGFFPIYQNLGVESLTVSMSGMFTGYDGTNLLSAANWENSVGIGQSNVEQGQDSFTSASELYDFAVNNKALVQVTIYTSDGSFIPKKSTSTAFRDNNSNISFKGYIKEFEQVYIRQDRNYYLLRFEIVDFGSAKCKTVVKSDKKKAEAKTGTTSGITNPITDDDRKYYLEDKDKAKRVQSIVDSINKGEQVTKIIKDIDDLSIDAALKIKLTFYAEEKGLNVAAYLTQLQDKFNSDREIQIDINIFKRGNDAIKGPPNSDARYRWEQNIKYRTLLCNKVNGTNCNLLKDLKIAYDNDLNNNNSSNNSNTKTPEPITPTTPILPIEEKTQAQIIVSSNMYNKRFTDKYITNQRILININEANRDFKISPEFKSRIYVSYRGNKNINNKYYPILNIRSFETGLDIGNYIAIPYDSISVKLERF